MHLKGSLRNTDCQLFSLEAVDESHVFVSPLIKLSLVMLIPSRACQVSPIYYQVCNPSELVPYLG